MSLAISPPSTVVPADDRIFAPVGHGAVWLGLGIVGLVAGLTLASWALRRRQVTTTAAEEPAGAGIAARYVSRLDDLEQQFDAGLIDERTLHHELSRALREFAGDTGTTDAPAMSATQLEAAGRTTVAASVPPFERPQFDAIPPSEPGRALEWARRAVTEPPPGPNDATRSR